MMGWFILFLLKEKSNLYAEETLWTQAFLYSCQVHLTEWIDQVFFSRMIQHDGWISKSMWHEIKAFSSPLCVFFPTEKTVVHLLFPCAPSSSCAFYSYLLINTFVSSSWWGAVHTIFTVPFIFMHASCYDVPKKKLNYFFGLLFRCLETCLAHKKMKEETNAIQSFDLSFLKPNEEEYEPSVLESSKHF